MQILNELACLVCSIALYNLHVGPKVQTLASACCSFCSEGGLEAVLQLLQHPELQYMAMSALVVLLGSHTNRCAQSCTPAFETFPAGCRRRALRNCVCMPAVLHDRRRVGY